MISYQKIFIYLSTLFLLGQALINAQSPLSSAIHNKYCNLTADYVIIGVGTAGGLMANRLSADLKTSVIALHSGQNLTEDPEIKFSSNAIFTVLTGLFGSSSLYQTGETVPQPNADNRGLLWVLALPEGGASSINAGAYCRETNFINAQWEAIVGPTLSVANITNIYKNLETYMGQTTNPAVRGTNGPINVRQVPNPTVVAQKFTQAVTNATGFPNVLDYNDPNTPIGPSSQLQYTQSGPNGVFRVSSATAFLNSSVVTPDGQGVNGRKLQILFGAKALRMNWSGTRATGVQFLQNGITQTAVANKGVIICAGLMSSPFLQLSGVGPKALLNSLNIPVVVDNADVGQNLADQTRVPLIFTSNPDDTPVPATDPGVFAQISWLPDPIGDQTIRQLRLSTINPIPGFVFALYDLCQPLSRGSIMINSADPMQPPVIDFGILSNPADLDLYVRGFQTYITNINTALQAIDTDYQLVTPDPATIADTGALTDFIKQTIGSNEHFQSHCQMAAIGGVVDMTGLVKGTDNVYVADNSIVPQDMDGSPMISAYGMAQYVANFLAPAA
jgi:choline dehydrogenase-like flavoprotein